MPKKIFLFLLLSTTLFARSQNDRPLFLAHFMPWHQTPDVSGYWGWHWTMNHFNPENMDEDGRREIASHYYPLTGPYDSMDADILEYQTLLMKLSGIDGVLVDWYGMEDFWDYGVLNQATQALFEACEKAGLSFAICYEDQTIKHMVDNNHLKAEDDIAHGKEVMQYMESNWFQSAAYQKINDQPLLLVFGPQYFQKTSDWNELFSVLSTPPLFFTENDRLNPAVGAYPWPPMWKSNAEGILTTEALNSYLRDFYNKAKSWDFLVAGAWPQFDDIYKEAGVSNGYGRLDANDGETLRSTLQKAIEQSPDAVQLVTWNDYGEGTMIEPTEEFGYQWLDIVLQARLSVDADFYGTSDLLQVPLQIFNLRKEQAGHAGTMQKLDEAFDALISGEIAQATDDLAEVGILVSVEQQPTNMPTGFILEQNYPNPFNPTTRISFHLSQSRTVTLNIFDITGRERQSVHLGTRRAGRHEVVFDAAGLQNGVYFYALQLDGQLTACRKMIVMH